MPREKEGYSETLTYLLNKYGPRLTVTQTAAESHICKRLVSDRLYGWTGQGKGKCMPANVLARQLCK